MKYVESIKIDFPSSIDLANHARNCYIDSYGISDEAIKIRPDENLLKWIESEYELFKVFENDRYKNIINSPFETVTNFVDQANSILNRRKSRAGKSLEHHLAEVFKISELKFEEQVITEENKKPDFIFPDSVSYNNPIFDSNKLVFLASKTTCKDRWRQILNEADRIDEKHLFTLQQGISSNQLSEMYKYNVKLVVPKPYLSSFPEGFRERILTLNGFIGMVKAKQI
jgi:type II restriction enzyme